MGGSSGGGGGDNRNEYRFAPHLEFIHQEFLTGGSLGGIYRSWNFDLKTAFAAAWESNPYTSRADMEIETGMLGAGYSIGDFPSMFDMFGKFMAGLDIETLWTQAYNQVNNGSEMNDLVSAFNQDTLDRMNQESLPMLNAGMRDIGAINSSAYVVGKALLEAKRQKEVTKFTSQIKHQGLLITQERWAKHLNWNSTVIQQYQELQRFYHVGAMDMDKLNNSYKEVEALWELNLFEYARAMIGTLGGGSPTNKALKGPSQTRQAIGGAMGGAAAGAQVGGGWGALIGGVLGAASSFL